MTDFKSLNLNENIILALQEKGYNNPTPIQAQSIPQIISGKDFLGIAQTGTGKTGAFALPILHLLSAKNKKTAPQQILALILTPTRELASQIADNIKYYGKNLELSCATIFGGVSEVNQIKALRTGVDILIATPGRLLDLTKQNYLDYSQLEILVLDEADRMLDMGFFDDVKKIINYLPEKKQSLLFSATMPYDIENLANKILKDPFKVEITPQATTVEKIDQKVYITPKNNKISILNHILNEHKEGSVLIFSQMKYNANRLGQTLEKLGFKSVVLHGNKSQNAREKSLKDFRCNRVKILIATDIVARGIDIPDISLVINYDLPRDYENYVHRIGRTARAGRNGTAISLCDTAEIKALRAIEKMIGMKIPVEDNSQINDIDNNIGNKIVGSKIGKSTIKTPVSTQERLHNSSRRDSNSRDSNRFTRKISDANSSKKIHDKPRTQGENRIHGEVEKNNRRPKSKKGGFFQKLFNNFLNKDKEGEQRNPKSRGQKFGKRPNNKTRFNNNRSKPR